MTISGIDRTATKPSERIRTSRNDATTTPSRALMPVTPAPSTQQPYLYPRAPRPDAPFVAHLIATAAQTPQTRALRRASPADALASYAGRPAAQGATSTARGGVVTKIA